MNSLHGENGMGNGIYHDRIVFGEMAPVLDAAFEHYLKADVLAEARSYRDEERNAVAEQRAAKYDRLKAKALRMHQERPRGLYAGVSDWREIAVLEVA